MAGYPQRTDMIQDPTYGAKASQDRQRAAIAPQPQAGIGGQAQGAMAPRMPPTALDAPSGRAGEPVTAGLDIGAGPGSEELGMDPTALTSATLRELYRRFPDENIARLIAKTERG